MINRINEYIESYEWDDGAYPILRYVMENDLRVSELLQIFYDGDGYTYLMYGRDDTAIYDKGLMRVDFLLLLRFLHDEIVRKVNENSVFGNIEVDYGLTKVQKYKIMKLNTGLHPVFTGFPI